MKNTEVLNRLDSTEIRREQDFAVPVNGVAVPLPYMVARSEAEVNGSDNGRVRFVKTKWTVALFAANRALDLEQKISAALSGVGKVEITPFPDGTPYQTNFEFTTHQVMK